VLRQAAGTLCCSKPTGTREWTPDPLVSLAETAPVQPRPDVGGLGGQVTGVWIEAPPGGGVTDARRRTGSAVLYVSLPLLLIWVATLGWQVGRRAH
jgi:hypothetical protein